MAESTSGHAENNPPAPLPQIPECDVSLDETGLYRLTHRRTRETATASTPEQADLQGAILRAHAALTRKLPFTTGDLR
ncbi:hypothetical protein [Nonomuraea rhodomycinica]|uniref:Uncharacterized protein n=1 Tax=Nonomuraea rhodomycinica TaxID=1712872 RepID=A0A7Y6IW73_9ACTN|nr:hypothetical protein [Nonomuraea rhodomycinica]NUW45524.1 hypothetical protein [Nonomuraea rhodomycinica]